MRTRPYLWPALVVTLVLAIAMPGLTVATTNRLGDDPVTLETVFDPAEPAAGNELTIETTITIDPAGTGEDEFVTWVVRFGEIGGLTVTSAECEPATGTTCEATWDEGDDTVIFQGSIAEPGTDPVSLDVTITGTIANDAEQVAAVTCAEASVLPAGATPEATPGPSTPCSGEEDSIEVPVVPPVVPTEEPTEVPTEQPTEVPTETPTEAPTAEPTEIPTEAPTATTEPSPTPEPTATATSEPTATATAEPTATTEPTATAEPTATVEPTPTATSQPSPTATLEPTVTPTSVPTEAPTETQEATAAPTDAPTEPATATEESTATLEPTPQPTSTTQPTATTAPSPTPDDDDDGSNIGLWIGVGALVVLAGAAGVVWNQRRNTT